jgi:hypothetical protein
MNCLIQDNNKKTCFSHSQLLSILLGLRDYTEKKHLKCKVIIHDKMSISDLMEKIKSIILIIYKKNISESDYIKLDFYKFIKDENVRNDIKYFVFKPKINVKGPLNTIQISQIMYKFQKLFYKDLYFNVGACDLIVDQTILNYKKNSFILNTDTSNLSGKHWVSIYTTNDTIEYFDSEGKSPRNKCLRLFIKNLQYIYPNRKFLYNTNKFQYYGNNCGVYSIYFIIQRLLKKNFHDITNRIINEKEIINYKHFLLA